MFLQIPTWWKIGGGFNTPTTIKALESLDGRAMICALSQQNLGENLGVSKKSGTPKSSILIGLSIIFTIHFGVPLFLETSICSERFSLWLYK